jgi:leucyl-tRNA synthetase
LAPEHPLVDKIAAGDHRNAVIEYRARISSKSDLERTDLAREKTGVFTGGFAINPANNERIPVWIADYVLMNYGTGAIMAVPAHDERDLEFARKFNLPIRQVVQPSGHEEPIGFTGDGTAVNSPLIDDLPSREAIRKIISWLEEHGLGKGSVNYKLRDWLFSRQRYWGEPFPIIWRDGKHEALPELELPIEPPPLDDFKPTGTGEPPLAKAKEWIRYSQNAIRETNTMPQWAGSCWYYLRFCDPKNDNRFVGAEAERYWMGGVEAAVSGGTAEPGAGTGSAAETAASTMNRPGSVDLYIGGTEHAVLHLLYARFWHKVLFDLGYVSKREPFQRLVNQGIILGEDNQKMSKSRGNIVSPDEVIATYGADAFRCYEMFMGPLEQMKPWSMKGVEGVSRFLARVWRLMMEENQAGEWVPSAEVKDLAPEKTELKVIHATIKKVTQDIETLSFNTAISQMMVFVNAFTNALTKPLGAMRTLLILLNPFAPHLTSELWEVINKRFGAFGGILEQSWPTYDEQFLIEDEVEIVIQVNGKVRDRARVSIDATDAELEQIALTNSRVAQFIEGRQVRKVVTIRKKLVNVVTD